VDCSCIDSFVEDFLLPSNFLCSLQSSFEITAPGEARKDT
jgi:hypothetical protein